MDTPDIAVYFDSPSNAYYPGTYVTGRVIMKVHRNLEIKGLKLVVEGAAYVNWDERRTVSRHQYGRSRESFSETRVIFIPYSSSEEYFRSDFTLLGESDVDPGETCYQFSTPLPPQLPSTFRGEYGGIKYVARAILERSWKYNQESSAEFFVVTPIDLNNIPSACDPIRNEFSKSFCWWWCQSGPLTLHINIPHKGFVPGELIPICLDAENASDIDILSVTCKLIKHIRWTCRRPNEIIRHTYDDLGNVFLEGVSARSAKSWQERIMVPSDLPPTILEPCTCIKQKFYLEIEAKSKGCHTNLSIEVPLLIGSVAVRAPAAIPGYPSALNIPVTSPLRSPSPALNIPVASSIRAPSPAPSRPSSGIFSSSTDTRFQPIPQQPAMLPHQQPMLSQHPTMPTFVVPQIIRPDVKPPVDPSIPQIVKPPFDPSVPSAPPQPRRSPSPAPISQPGVYHSLGGYPEPVKKPPNPNQPKPSFDINLLSSAYPSAPYPITSSEPVRASSEGPSPAPGLASKLPFKIPSFTNLKFLK